MDYSKGASFQYISKLIDRWLLSVYKRMRKIDREAIIQKQKKKCKCEERVVFYESTKIRNNSDRIPAITIGRDTHICGELFAYGKDGKIEIGQECYVGKNTYIWSSKHIFIGNRVLIGHNCNIFDNDTHPKNKEERNRQYKYIISFGQPKSIDLNEKEIVIEDDVWIAANCTVLKGCKIGRGSIIGTGTIVTGDIPANSIVYGDSSKIYRNRGGSCEDGL